MSKVGECKELFEAIRNKDLNRIRELVESRQCVNVKDEYDNTPLHVASSYGYIDVVEFLVKNGAYVNAEDKYG
ncbi:MAG: ankyrin repeat domain-containing protein, partial [Infirmifilum sp.]